MTRQTWILTDVTQGVYESDFSVRASEVDSGGSWTVTQRRLRGGLSDGVDLVEIDNGKLRLSVIPTRGMGLWKAQIGDETLGWRSPVRGPVHPHFVPLHEPTGLGWLDGFDELLVRCGLESNGAPEFNDQGQLVYPLHGRIGNRPAHHVQVTVDEAAGTITLLGLVEETRFHFQKLRLYASVTTSFDSTAFTVNDRVENYGGTDAQMQMLYHLNLGEPTLQPGDQLVVPVQSIRKTDGGDVDGWNTYGPPIAGQPENCYFFELRARDDGHTQVLVKNPAGSSGTAVRFNTNDLPCFTLWKNLVAADDGYVTGLEPGTNYPNARSAETEAGRVVSLAPGESWSAEVEVERLQDASAVEAVEQQIGQLQGK